MKTARSVRVVPRPFLKWAGGKGQLLDELAARVAEAKPYGRYHEPFVGGGALFFQLARNGQLKRKAYLSDHNGSLIATYQAVQEDVDRVIDLLRAHEAQHGREYYYALRAQAPRDLFERGARIIYLNRTCFNGLFRENSKGEFNVPFGRYKNPTICDEENLRAVARALGKARIEQRHFKTVLHRAKAGDLVYFDPPYHPVSKTSSFTAYDKGGFGEDAQRQLAEVYEKLSENGVKVLLSNSMTELICELYRGYTLEKVYASRSVNSKVDRRGKIAEALIRNF